MRPNFLKLPIWSAALRPATVSVTREADGHILEGNIITRENASIPIANGVPIFLRDGSEVTPASDLPTIPPEQLAPERAADGQARTNITFSDKWRRFKNYGLEPGHQEFLFTWYCKKLGLPDLNALKRFYSGFQHILEVGPGSGFNTRFMAENTKGQVIAADISEAALTTFENTKHLSNCHVLQSDLMHLPLADESFDFIIADGVLHHTPDTHAAVQALYRKLKPGGQFFFYVYRQMGPARQFCDRHLRELFSKLPPEDCYKACEGLTELGRELSKIKGKVKLDRGVEALNIPPGEHDVQRLLYYSFVKCFWNDAFDWETNNMVNFDWYHPYFAWQHTEEEVRQWLADLGVKDFSFQPANPNGISTLLKKPLR